MQTLCANGHGETTNRKYTQKYIGVSTTDKEPRYGVGVPVACSPRVVRRGGGTPLKAGGVSWWLPGEGLQDLHPSEVFPSPANRCC